jgi:class 3 adenylate cyclase
MDYTAIGETTHLAARTEQAARPGTVLIAPATLHLVEGFVAVLTGLSPCWPPGCSDLMRGCACCRSQADGHDLLAGGRRRQN